jgi:hypothetical protein
MDEDSEDKIIEELKNIRVSLSEYQREQLVRSEINRVENTQILISLGFVGAAISVYVRNEVPSGPLGVIFYIVFVSSVVYLGTKTLISPLSKELENETISKIDHHWLQNLFAVQVVLSFVTGSLWILTEVLIKYVAAYDTPSTLTTIISILASGLVLWRYFKTSSRAEIERQRRQAVSEILLGDYSPQEIEDFFYENPWIIDPEIEMATRDISRIFDFIGQKDDERIGIEIKTHSISTSDVNEIIGMVYESENVDRAIIITPLANKPAKDRISYSDVVELFEVGEDVMDEMKNAGDTR